MVNSHMLNNFFLDGQLVQLTPEQLDLIVEQINKNKSRAKNSA